MSSAVKADFIGLVLQSEGTSQTVVTTTEEDFVEKVKNGTKDAHGVSPLLFNLRVENLEGKNWPRSQRETYALLDVGPGKTSLSPPANSSFNIAARRRKREVGLFVDVFLRVAIRKLQETDTIRPATIMVSSIFRRQVERCFFNKFRAVGRQRRNEPQRWSLMVQLQIFAQFYSCAGLNALRRR